jgi:protein TonB
MQSLFQHEPHESPPGRDELLPAPSLLVELPSWPRVFFGNLCDVIAAPFLKKPPLYLSSRPAAFWPDVFVNRRMPVAPLRQSALYHIFVVVAVWGFSYTWLGRPAVRPRNPFENTKIVYYPTSAYLPALVDETDDEPAKPEKKADPVYAQQRIRSVPRHPDNDRQTIITPSPLTIHNDVPLPNIVKWSQPEAPVSVAAAASLRMRLPNLAQPAPIAPPPQVTRSQMSTPAFSAPVFIPPPTPIYVASGKPKLELPVTAPSATSIQGRQLGEIRLPQSAPSSVLLRSAVVEKSTVPTRAAGKRRPGADKGADMGGAAPSSLALAGAGGNGKGLQQLVALSVNPAMPSGPVRAPEGNRRGTFAASPEGRTGASGAPDIRGNGHSGGGGTSTGGARTPLAGVTVEKPPEKPVEMAAVRPMAPSSAKPSNVPSARDVFAQALARTRVPEIPRTRTTPSSGAEPKVEDYGAGPKRYYSMTLNMPNLTSAGGSWIVRFAELSQTHDASPVSAPVATVKVDPAYPTELLRNGVEGVVMLYAIIHADGSVSAVRVLRGVDSRLDSSACAALKRWHFRPGTKHGSAIDLEAVVQIPFRSRPVY